MATVSSNDAEFSSFPWKSNLALALGKAQQSLRTTYDALKSAESAALLIKACIFPLSLAAKESATIAASAVLSRAAAATTEGLLKETPPTG